MNLTASSSFAIDQAAVSRVLSRVRGAGILATEQTAQQVYRQSQVLVPVLTGALLQSGYTGQSEESEAVVAVVGYSKEYARFVEFGTFQQQAEPYLRPALDASRQLFLDAAVEALRA